jgi:hypothetical protein
MECPIWIASNLGTFELNLDYLEFIRTRHCAARARLSADAAARHCTAQARLSADAATRQCGRGPPVSSPGLPCLHGMALPAPDGRGPLPAAPRRLPLHQGPLSFLLPPPCGASTLTPSFSFRHGATPSLTLLRFKWRRSPPRSPFHPVPLSSELEHRSPAPLTTAAHHRPQNAIVPRRLRHPSVAPPPQ